MQATQPTVEFTGSSDEQKLAKEVFDVARFQGRFFTANAPIYLKREQLIGFLAAQRKGAAAKPEAVAKLLDAAMAQNAAIFGREETDDGVVTFVTTQAGSPPAQEQADTLHTLAKRFMEPTPLPPAPDVEAEQSGALIATGWAQRLDIAEMAEEAEIDSVGEDRVVTTIATSAATEAAAPAVEDQAAAEPVVSAVEVAAVTPAPVQQVEAAPTVALSELSDEQLRELVVKQLDLDDRFVAFGEQYFAEDMVDRYSRGDLRRIREYIAEMNEPLSDEQLLQSLFNRRANDPTYEAGLFSINYRLSREKREFEFVGTKDSRLWSTVGLAPLGTTLRKASELGSDYRFLLDEEAVVQPDPAILHTLTFYEWAYGLLPLDGELRHFFPAAYLSEQKTATLRFEVPQLYATFLAELRYPTANRGGYLVGFDEFYHENVVPGAILTIERTADNDGVFVIRYTAQAEYEDRLLQIDERRSRYVFRPQMVAQDVDEAWLLTETRYPNLNNVKPLDEKERRRVDTVIGVAFERVAENTGTNAAPRYWSTPEELLPIVNIERPFTLRALQEALESPQHSQFESDPDTPGAFFYTPPAKEKASGGSKKRSARARVDEFEDEDEEF